jgi:uncharacterized membrane-anchored protein YhcB (DUF1043 family)
MRANGVPFDGPARSWRIAAISPVVGVLIGVTLERLTVVFDPS